MPDEDRNIEFGNPPLWTAPAWRVTARVNADTAVTSWFAPDSGLETMSQPDRPAWAQRLTSEGSHGGEGLIRGPYIGQVCRPAS